MTIDPAHLLEQVASTVPKDLHQHIIVVGSLAAAYYHRERLAKQAINTKDADLIVHPAGAVDECVEIAERLLADGWQRTGQCFKQANPEPIDELRAIRLYPPESKAFFIELLGLPEPGEPLAKTWVPCKLNDGWYGMPCFRFMTLLREDRRRTSFGIEHASPSLMALANLLSHPVLGSARMSTDIGGRSILRSAKDLGRVLALAYLEPDDELENWEERWESALRAHFASEALALAARVGSGISELLGNEQALAEAHFTADMGLLGGLGVTPQQMHIAGTRLLADVVKPFMARFA